MKKEATNVDRGLSNVERFQQPTLNNRRLALGYWTAAAVILGASDALAQSQRADEIFKSIQSNLGNTSDPTPYIIGAIATVVVIAALVFFSKRTKREAVAKALNHPGKLIKEMCKAVDLKPAEVRQLKQLAEKQNVSNPLALLLCPSVLAKAVQEQGARVDRKLLARAIQRVSR